MTGTSAAPPGFTLRRPTMDDLDAVVNLYAADSIAIHGSTDFTRESVEAGWRDPDFDLAADAWLVTAPGGRLAGYGDIWHQQHTQIGGGGVVHPDCTGHGVGCYLLRLTEARAREHVSLAPEGARVSMRQWVSTANTPAQALLRSEGYAPVRRFYRMRIQMDMPPPAPDWPAGITLRPFVPERDARAVHAAMDEAFEDHWGHLPMPYETWEQFLLKRADFDPTLWVLALDGDELAGAAVCRCELEMGFVDDLGVRRPWRRKGLALALLYQSFGEFYRRGVRTVALGVDAGSLTGATRLYERAGMSVYRQWDVFEKELRPGIELSTQALAHEAP